MKEFSHNFTYKMMTGTNVSIGHYKSCSHKFCILFISLIVFEVLGVTGQNFIKYSNNYYPGLDLCALDDVTRTLYRVETLDDCSLLCAEMVQQQYRLGCLAFNYRTSQQLCELFVYAPNSYKPTAGCVHYQQPQLFVIPPAYTNIAKGRPAYQSSDFWDPRCYTAYASRAVDGNADPVFYDNSCSHTKAVGGVNSWWAVDLGSVYQVRWVNITQRADYAERLVDFAVIMTNSPPTNYAGKNYIPPDRSICAFYPGYPPAASTTTLVCRKDLRPAQYLYIELSDPGGLQLSEVMVFGDKVSTGK